jgi:aspartate 1-decarboxylase
MLRATDKIKKQIIAIAINPNMKWMLRSKLHKAIVTEADLSYVGSVTIDQDLIAIANFSPGEKVLIVSNTSGQRLETYIIEGERGSGVICINGAAAHVIKKGEEVIIMGFELVDNPEAIKPAIVLLEFTNGKNRFKQLIDETKPLGVAVGN